MLTPGKPEVVVPQGDLQIKNATLPDELQDGHARTSVKLTYQSLATVDDDDEEDEEDEDEPYGAAVTTVLCSLTPGKVCALPSIDMSEDASEVYLRSNSPRVKSSSSRTWNTSSRPPAKSEHGTRRVHTDG